MEWSLHRSRIAMQATRKSLGCTEIGSAHSSAKSGSFGHLLPHNHKWPQAAAWTSRQSACLLWSPAARSAACLCPRAWHARVLRICETMEAQDGFYWCHLNCNVFFFTISSNKVFINSIVVTEFLNCCDESLVQISDQSAKAWTVRLSFHIPITPAFFFKYTVVIGKTWGMMLFSSCPQGTRFLTMTSMTPQINDAISCKYSANQDLLILLTT